MTEIPSSTRRARDPFLDNARGLLITMVVVGHTLESFDVLDQVVPDMVYTAIYSFHMAAFVVISGFLSRSYRNEPRQLRRLLTSIVIPYLIFQMVHEVAKHFLEGRNLELQLFLPAWTLWFLLALLMWRLLSPLLRSLRHPLLIAVAVSVIAPLDPDLDSTFTLGRMTGMLPFFVLGLVSTPETLARIKAFPRRWLGGAVMVAALLCALVLRKQVPASWFFLRSAYDEDASVLFSVAVHLGALVTGVVGTIGLLLITPRGRSALSVLGTRSLTIYLLHPVLLLPIRYADELPAWLSTWWAGLLLVPVGVALTLLLGSSYVARATRWVTDPPIGQLLITDPADDAGRGAGKDAAAESGKTSVRANRTTPRAPRAPRHTRR